MDIIRRLTDPALVARTQQFFGVELIKPGTCDQQTQTKRSSLENGDQILDNGIPCFDGEAPIVTQCEHVSSNNCKVCGKDDRAINGLNKQCDITPSSAGQKGATHRDAELNNNENNPSKSDLEQSCFGNSSRHNTRGVIDGERKSLSNHGSSTTHRSKPDINPCTGKTPKNTAVTNRSSENIQPTRTETEQGVRIKYKALFYLAHFGAFLGNEEFYLTFFPFCMWNLDSLIVRQVGLLWAIVMYLGQATKDYLRWPRPQCPPVIRLETSYLQEFSMPSTHAMAGTAIPMYLAYLAIVRYQVSIPLAVFIALLWYSTSCFSRLYLGVHTFLDLIVGTLYAVIVFFTFIRYIEGYDLYQQTHPFAPFMVLTTALLLCTVFYPSGAKNSSKGDAIQIVSAVAGMSFAAWLAYQLEYTHEPEILKPYEIPALSLTWLSLSILRFLFGLVFVGVCYFVIRKSTIRLFSYLYGLDIPDKNNPSVLTGYKFTTYFSIGCLITFVVPLLHSWLSIGRCTIYTEVL